MKCSGALLLTLSLNGCQKGPYDVRVPRKEPLGNATLSFQMGFRKSILGPASPRERYRDKLAPRLHNRLMDAGFTLKKEEADLHLFVQVYEVTTGSSERQARCELLVELYQKWPGNLDRPPAYPPKDGQKPIFSMMVTASEHQKINGYPREMIAERAAEDAIQEVVDYLVRAKTQPLT